MKMEMRHLKVVCAIANTGSVSKAASRLGLAQANVTMQLQRIERTLGGRLFERSCRGSRPTVLGELVVAQARVLLLAMEDLQNDAAQLTDARRIETVVGYRLGTTGGPIIGGMVRRLSQAHPEAPISTHASFFLEELATMLLNDEIGYAHIGLCGNAVPPGPDLRWQTVALDAVCITMPEDHRAARSDDVELADLAGENWVAAPGDSCFGDCFASACARAGFMPRRLLESDLCGHLDMVESGTALGLCQPTFRPPVGVTMRPLRGAPLLWRSMLGWNPRSPAAAAAARMLTLARESYQEALIRNPAYLAWRRNQPDLGGSQDVDTNEGDC